MRPRILTPAVLVLAAAPCAAQQAAAPASANRSAPIERSALPLRVHVFEDYETEIEKRWWLRGEAETEDLPASLSASIPNRRAWRAAETLNFDRKMGDQVNKVKGVIFNPVPGPPMGDNTRLSFRYKLAGTDTIKVQIYSLSNNYHRFLSLAGLPRGEWRAATVDMTQARRPDGSGGALARDERIDDIQFYVGRGAELSIDDIVLFEAAPEGEAEPFPARIIFTGWFDTGEQGKEWPGDFKIVPHAKPLTWDAAESVINPEGGKPWIRVGLRGLRALSHQTAVRFRYRLTAGETLSVALVDAATKAQYERAVVPPATGRWAQAGVEYGFPHADDAAAIWADEIRFQIDTGAMLQIDDLLIYEPGR